MTLIDVPQSGQTLGQTQAPIRGNFQSIDAAFLVNHVPYNTTNAGMHNVISFPVQNPVPTPLVAIPQIYAQLSTLTTQPELVFTRQTGATGPSPVEFTSAGWANPGWTRLPSGILLKWHRGVAFSGSTAIVPLNSDVPGSPPFTTVYTVLCSTENPNANYNNNIGIKTIVGTTVTFSQFGIAAPGSSVTISYLAIGV